MQSSINLAFLKRLAWPPLPVGGSQIRIADLFSGAGGMTLGIVEAGRRAGVRIEIVLAMDVDPAAVTVYEDNFLGALVMCHRVESLFDGELGTSPTIREEVARARFGGVDVLLGGPPCQGHSDLNNHTRRQDDRNELYLRMVRAAEVLRARVLVVENVPTVVRSREGVVETAVRALREDYEVAHRVVAVGQLGMPQRRRRHLLLACRRGTELPPPEELLDLATQASEDTGVRTVREAIGDLAGIEPLTEFDRSSAPSDDNIRRMAYLFDNGLYDLPNPERPSCHRDKSHSYISMYGRLHWDEPAQTITTGFRSMGQGRYVHPSERRTLTPHEAARLQTFPDYFAFRKLGSTALARLIGNAVPPALTLRVGSYLIPALLRASSDGASRGRGSARTYPLAGIRSGRPGRWSTRSRMSDRNTPGASSPDALRRMQSVRRRDTHPERALRSELNRLGLRYRVDHSPLPGIRRRADVVFPGARVAVYVDGCFWHVCPEHATWPRANAKWWREKLERNVERDRAADRALEDAGWLVLRIWEHEAHAEAARRVATAVSERVRTKVRITHITPGSESREDAC